MNITELDSYNLADAVKFNDHLNPRIWDSTEHLRPEVRDRLLAIADDFRESLGLRDLAVEDITISGSNAAYTYTPNSDIDLHLLVDVPDDEVYRELFTAKKFQYNEQHDIEIGGADVELYVQDTKEPHISQGVYSVKNNRWISVPRRVKSVVDDTSTKHKFETVGHQIERAIASGDEARMQRMINKIKKMRQTGLEKHGEFGPENLAFKILRNQGLIKQLYTARTVAKDQKLSLDEKQASQPFVYGFKTVAEASTPDGVSPETKMYLSEEPPADDEAVLRDFVDFCVKELKIDSLPTIKLRRDPQWSVVHKTFGRYTNDRNLLEVAWGQRHLMDVLRTVAHELTHRHQHERDGQRMGPDAGETGSPWENEANARAGILMRDYGRLHPELFDSGEAKDLAEGLSWSSLDEGLSVQDKIAIFEEYAIYGNLTESIDHDKIPPSTLWEEQEEDVRQELLKNPRLFENTKDFADLTTFLGQYISNDIKIGKHYLYTSVLSLLPGHIINLAHFNTPHKLVAVKNNQLFFEVNGEILPYPKSGGISGDLLKHIQLFSTTDNFNKFHMLLKLKFSEWNIRTKVLDNTMANGKLDESLRGRAAAAIVATLLGQPVGTVAQSIQGILGMIRDAGTVAQQARNITRAGLNAEVQQEIVNYARGVGGDAGSQNLSQLYQLQRQLQQQEQQPEPAPQRREPQNESASGYIPTKRQAKDPRYSMALTVDIKPGQVGREANKLKLRTDSQGHPQLARTDGLFEQLMTELGQFKKSYTIGDFKINAFESIDSYRRWQQTAKASSRGMTRYHANRYANMFVPAQLIESDDQFAQRKQQAQQFSRQFQQLDQREAVDLAVGNSISLLSSTAVPGNNDHASRIELAGFVVPKKIVKINLDNSNKIDTLEFSDGSRFPETAEFTTIGGVNITNTILFSKPAAAKQAFTQVWMLLSRLEGQGWQIEKHLSESIVKENAQLDEVRMAPSDLRKFAASPEAQGIRAGFEAELVFAGIGEPEYDEMEADMDADERAYSIRQVIDFFQNDDWGYGMSDSAANRLESDLDDMYMEWRDEQIRQDFQHDSEDLISDLWLEERPMIERIHDALTDGLELSDDEADAVIALHARRERGEISGSDMSEAELEMASQYSEARSIAMDILEEDVQGSIDNQDGIYDQALDDYRDNYSVDDSSFFSDVGLRWMSDIADQFRLDWPYMQGGGGSEGGWSEHSADNLAASLKKALGVKVKVSGGYHSATRDDTSWIIEPDSSLEPDDPEDMAVEIITPPMPLAECLKKMQEFFDWAESNDAYANRSTGFHMGVSLPTQFNKDVDFVKLALFLGDEYVLRSFGRTASTYCESAMKKIRNRLGNDRSGQAVGDAMKLMQHNLIELAHRSIANNSGFGKYTSINPKGDYIEFRSAGNRDYFKDINKLKNTLLRYAQAMQIAGNPAAYRNEYYKKLYKLIAPAQQDPALALFAKYSAGELTAEQLKHNWAELALIKERPKQGKQRDWEAVDFGTGQVLGTVRDSSITNATNYFRDTLKLDGFQVREREPEATSPRAKLARRIKQPKAQAKDDDQDSEQLQARIDPAVAQIPRDWEFYNANTGQVIDRITDINMMQANAVRDDWVRRSGWPDEFIRMRSVPTAASAERARARVQDLEPDVVQNFPEPAGTQFTVQGVPSWSIYNVRTGAVVRTFFQRNYQDAIVYAGQWLEANGYGLEGYAVKATMETP